MTGVRVSRVAALAVILLFQLSPSSMTQAAERDFSETLDQSWNFDAPSISESRFRAQLASYGTGSREAREITTQIARSLGLQRRFAEADATLDALLPQLDKAPARVRVRYLLERGRVLNSSGKPAEAVPLFEQAAEAALQDPLPGADFYRVDALHMLGIAASEGERLRWNLDALAAADRSSDGRARGWRASLLNNIGWTYHDRGDYSTALDYWRKALAASESAGDRTKIRVAKWTVARGLRSLDHFDEAEKIQRELMSENDKAGTPDGFVYEELAEIALARHDAAAAKIWAAKAYAYLKHDIWLAANEKPRLDRLAEIGGIGK